MGSEITAADMFLIPQLYNARRFNLDLSEMENLLRIDEACGKLSAFKKAHPENQVDHP